MILTKIVAHQNQLVLIKNSECDWDFWINK